MKRTAFLAILLLAAVIDAAALDQPALPWMRTTRSVVDMSLAGSGSLSQETMAWAAFGNTASVPFASQKFAVDASYSFLSSTKMNNNALGFSMNVNPKWGVSAAVSYGYGPSYANYDASGKLSGRYMPGYFQVNAGFGSKFHEFVSGGMCLYYARQDIAQGVNSWTAGLNGYLNVHWSDYYFGAGIINFGVPAKNAAGEAYGTPTSVQLNFMYDKALAANWRIQLNAGIDGFVPECGKGLTNPKYMGEFFGKVLAQGIQYRFTGQMGAQVSWNDNLFFRCGYHYAPDILPVASETSIPVYVPAHASVGVGVKLFGFILNAAYLFGSKSINNTFSVSIGYTF